jgi:hypothetical protein
MDGRQQSLGWVALADEGVHASLLRCRSGIHAPTESDDHGVGAHPTQRVHKVRQFPSRQFAVDQHKVGAIMLSQRYQLLGIGGFAQDLHVDLPLQQGTEGESHLSPFICQGYAHSCHLVNQCPTYSPNTNIQEQSPRGIGHLGDMVIGQVDSLWGGYGTILR